MFAYINKNVLEFMGTVKHHIQDVDFESIKFAAHKIKSGLAMMKTFSLHEIALEIHSVCEVGQDIDKLRKLAISFADEYLNIEQLIKRSLKK